MAQYKKEEVREAIEKAALELFYKNGYAQTKIKEIAGRVPTSIGNIYRYFKSKRDIFYAIISEGFIDEVRSVLIKRTIVLHKEQFGIPLTVDELDWYHNQYFNYLIQNKMLLTLLCTYNQGTKYENGRNELVWLMLETKKDILKESNIVISNDFLNTALLIINSNIDLTIEILNKEIGLEEMKGLLKNIDLYHIKGMSALWLKMIGG